MALADRHLTPPPAVHGTPCSIGNLLDTLTGDELAAFKHMLGSGDWTANMVYDAVIAEGYPIGRQSIGRHRGQRCRCAKDAA